jgi:hypothetical protein
MAKRKKRNAITLVLLLLALAVLFGVYFWSTNYTKDKEEQEETPAIDLVKIDAAQISSIHYVRKDADIILVKQEDTWVSKEEPGRPINQDYVKAMLNAIKDVKAERAIAEKPENLADFGLEEPEALLEVTLKDGKTITIKTGIEVTNSQGYYGLVNDDGTVYQLPKELGLALQYDNTQMTAIAKSPDIDANNITHISITNKNGTDYEIKKDAEKLYNNSGNNIYPWRIIKPYGEGYTADEAKVKEIQPYYTNINFFKCVDYKGDNLSTYGLDAPAATIKVGYFVARTEKLDKPEMDPETKKLVTEKTVNDPHEYMLYIGNKDEEGNYYVRLEGSNSVYTLEGERVDKMLNINAFNLLNRYTLLPNIVDVDKIQAIVNGTTYNMEIKQRTEKDDKGKDTTVSTYYFNGKEAEDKAFKTNLYQVMISSQYDAEINEDINLEGVEPVLSMSFHLIGEGEGTVSAKFYPYNDSFSIIQRPDGLSFFADKRRIDAIVEAITSFTGKENK